MSSSHNMFHMPLVNKMFEVAMRDVSADYYGIVNSDILLSDRIFLVLDQIDAMVEEGTVSPIVDPALLHHLESTGRRGSRRCIGGFADSCCRSFRLYANRLPRIDQKAG